MGKHALPRLPVFGTGYRAFWIRQYFVRRFSDHSLARWKNAIAPECPRRPIAAGEYQKMRWLRPQQQRR